MKNIIDNIDSEKEWVRDFYDYAKSIPTLTSEEEKRLFREYRAGNKSAKAEIVEGNLTKVFGIVNHFSNCGIPLEDLMQEAYLSMLDLVDEYDVNSDNSFIRDVYIKIWRSVEDYVIYNTGCKITKTRFIHLRKGTQEELDRDVYKSSFTEVPFEDQVEDSVYIEQLLNYLKESGTHDRTIEILKMKLGRDYDKEYTNKEIAERIGISPSRVHQIDHRVQRKLEPISYIKSFDFYIPEPKPKQINVKPKMNMEEIYRTREELKNRYYRLLLDFSKEELEEIKRKLPKRKANVVKQIYRSDLLSPTLRELDRGTSKIFFDTIYPQMISILAEKNSPDTGFKLCRREENTLLLKNDVIIRGLSGEGPCRGFTIAELSFLLHRDISFLKRRLLKSNEIIGRQIEIGRSKNLTK